MRASRHDPGTSIPYRPSGVSLRYLATIRLGIEAGRAMLAMLVELGTVEATPDSDARGVRFPSVRRMADTTA